jgi:hypothetical protein
MSEAKFKVGNRVRVSKPGSYLFQEVCVVDEIVRTSEKIRFFVKAKDDERRGWFLEHELEPAPVVNECSKPDNVNHPPHYNQGGIECIEAIKAALGDGFVAYLRGNVIKYLWRCEHKGGVEDLKKAAWYLDRAIKEMEVNGE